MKGWSTEEKKEKAEEGTEEMGTWRSLNQEETDECWKKLAEKIEEEVLDKCKVDDSERGALSLFMEA